MTRGRPAGRTAARVAARALRRTAAGGGPGVPDGRGKVKGHSGWSGLSLKEKMPGGDLLSHTLPGAVPSALEGLTSGFGM